MSDNHYKKYTRQAKMGIRGESFFESLVCNYCLPHHIVGSKDLGIDYICEWVYGDEPTGVLFAVQVKTFSEETAKPEFIGIEESTNKLKKYKIHNTNLKIDDKTLHYWKGLGMPVYLFAIVQNTTETEKETLDCYYKRFTEVMTNEVIKNNFDYYQPFYKVNKGNSFLAFKNSDEETFGFARDFFIDHVHWSYYKGTITYLDPLTIGLKQFLADGIFVDMLKIYQDKIILTFDKTRKNLESLGYINRKTSTSGSPDLLPVTSATKNIYFG